MITFFTPKHQLHAPEYEFFRGERVACFESPSRADFVQEELMARGHEIREPSVDSAAGIPARVLGNDRPAGPVRLSASLT